MKFVPLNTDRLTLDQLIERDTDDLVHICSKPDTYRFLLTLPVPYTEASAKDYIEKVARDWENGDRLVWGVHLKACDTKGNTTETSINNEPLIGCVEIRQNQPFDSLGILIDPFYKGQGIAQEAIIAVVNWARANCYTKDNEIYYAHHIKNLASQKLAEKLGFQYIKTLNSKDINRKDRIREFFDYKAYRVVAECKI